VVAVVGQYAAAPMLPLIPDPSVYMRIVVFESWFGIVVSWYFFAVSLVEWLVPDFIQRSGKLVREVREITALPDRGPGPFSRPGLVGLAKTIATEKNTQFSSRSYHPRGVHTILGKIVKGMELADKIGRLEVDGADHPMPGNEVVIDVGCGELQPRRPSQQFSSRNYVSPDRKRGHSQRETEPSVDRSRSPRRGVEGCRPQSQLPRQRSTEHRRRNRSAEVEDEHHRRRQRHHHHHHHHRHRRRHYRSPASDDGERGTHHNSIDKSGSPDKHRNSHNKDEQVGGVVPTGPRGYYSSPRYRQESNFGRLSSALGYEDIRDDEDRLRAEERRRKDAPDKVEPAVIFKGRGAMKFRERNY
jgi:hypothetical protein